MWYKEIMVRDLASLVPDQNIYPSGEISSSHMDTCEGIY